MQRVWHRKFDGCWYATFTEGDGQNQIKLLKGPKDRATKKLAEELLVKELKPSKKKSAPDWLLVNGVLRGFLRHSKRRITSCPPSPGTRTSLRRSTVISAVSA